MRLWRGKPVGVTPYASQRGCIISPSYGLKTQGVKTAMRIRDARLMSPNMILRQSNLPLYREVHRRFCRIFRDYSPDVVPKSIDEAVIFLRGTPALRTRTIEDTGLEIKRCVKEEIGSWMLVNVSIGTNSFLAKTAAGLLKPEGRDRIDNANLREVFATLRLTDLCGINTRYEARLNSVGISTPIEFLDADPEYLCKRVFRSINGFYWYRELRGYEAETFEHDRKTFRNSVTLGQPVSSVRELLGVTSMLCQRASGRMRQAGFACKSLQLMLRYGDGTHFRTHITLRDPVSSLGEVFRAAVLSFNRQKGTSETINEKAVCKICVDLINLS